MAKLLETVDLVTNFYTYEGVVKALSRISLVVDTGATFGLVGESGCGKSVTALSILGLVPSPPGRVAAGRPRPPSSARRIPISTTMRSCGEIRSWRPS